MRKISPFYRLGQGDPSSYNWVLKQKIISKFARPNKYTEFFLLCQPASQVSFVKRMKKTIFGESAFSLSSNLTTEAVSGLSLSWSSSFE